MSLDPLSATRPLAPRKPAPHAPVEAAAPARRATDELRLDAPAGPPRDAAAARKDWQQLFLSARTVADQKAKEAARARGDVAAARAIGYGEVHLGRHGTRDVVQDPEDVNRPRGPWADPAQVADAYRQIAANAPLEAAALPGRPEAEREAYRALTRTLSPEPAGRLALQALLLEGRLDPPLLDALAALTKPGATDPAIPASALLADLAREVLLPAAIAQQSANSCAVAATQQLLAHARPAAYVALVAGLASPEGVATLPGGGQLPRVPGTERARDFKWVEDGKPQTTPDHRSHPARLLQSALMELGNGAATYDPVADAHSDGRSGLEPGGLEAVVAATTGRPAALVHDLGGWLRPQMAKLEALDPTSPEAVAGATALQAELAERREALMDDLLANVKAGRAVPVILAAAKDAEWDGAHSLLVLGEENGRLRYLNPHGAMETMAVADLARHVAAIVVPGT